MSNGEHGRDHNCWWEPIRCVHFSRQRELARQREEAERDSIIRSVQSSQAITGFSMDCKTMERLYDEVLVEPLPDIRVALARGHAAMTPEQARQVRLGQKGVVAWNRVQLDDAEIRRLYVEERLSGERIAPLMGVSPPTIYARIRAMGLTRAARGAGTAPRRVRD